jgi:aminoglycoside/choline kinase family phosphotransferase
MDNDTQDQPSQEIISFAEGYLRSKNRAIGEPTWQLLSGGGSDRVFYRLSYQSGSLIIMVNAHPSSNEAGINENDSFYYIGTHLRSQGIGTPEIHKFQRERGWFIIEDLGSTHLRDKALEMKRDPVRLRELYQQLLDLLPSIQVKGAQGFDATRIHSVPYDSHFVRTWESGYFFRTFLKGYCNMDITEEFLHDEFQELANALSLMDRGFFLYRDFQSNNIMIKAHQFRFVDFQGGRKGPLQYDLASLLLDPYVDLDEELHTTLIDYYLKQLSLITTVERKKFLSEYPFIALHRAMQILGAFAYLSTIKKKFHFTTYMPAAIRNLKNLCSLEPFSPYKNLRKVVGHL